jgi:tetratricopeptide (TPR) repeat protein
LLTVALVIGLRALPRISFETGAAGPPEPAASRTVERVYFGPPNSLAVLLPTSGKPDTDLAALPKGLAIHLVDQLAAEPRLHVLSPNSSFHFSPGEIDARIIAERLTARHLLFLDLSEQDGGVLAVPRLYDAKRQRELSVRPVSAVSWSDLSGRLVDDVLTAMNVESRVDRSRMPADEALLPYLEGLTRLHERDPAAAQMAFGRSLAKDNGFSAAQVGLAQAMLASIEGPLSDGPVETARQQLRQALAIEPGNGRALALRSHLEFRQDRAFQKAFSSARLAVARLPGDAIVLSMAATSALSMGEFEEAVNWQQAAVDRDPLNLWLLLSLGHAQEFAGDLDAALSTFRQALILNPDLPAAAAFRARIKLLQDKPEVAMEEAEAEADPFWARYARILSLFALQQEDEAVALLDAMIDEDGHRAAIQIAEIQAFRQQADLAFEWLERASQQRDGGLAELAGNRFFDPLRDDARWAELLDRLGLPRLDSDPVSD